MTQLKMAIWPDAPPAKDSTSSAAGRPGGAPRLLRQGDYRLNGCSPKPSKRDRPPHFRELQALNAQQHVT